jgi:carbon monoxide dehydrogenase subunit G
MGLEKYESKQRQVTKPAAMIYNFISDFTIFTPAVQGKVEEWSATPDECSFKVQGMRVGLRIVEREENKHIKIAADEENGVPVDFSFWIQMQPADVADTRIRMVLHAELNMMMKMMIGSKIQGGLDKAVEGLAMAFNQMP